MLMRFHIRGNKLYHWVISNVHSLVIDMSTFLAPSFMDKRSKLTFNIKQSSNLLTWAVFYCTILPFLYFMLLFESPPFEEGSLYKSDW